MAPELVPVVDDGLGNTTWLARSTGQPLAYGS